jgi:hypothetical protein
MKIKSILLSGAITAILATPSHAQTAKPTTAPTSETSTKAPIEYASFEKCIKIDSQNITPCKFYFGNRVNNAAVEPTIGEDKNIKFLEIRGTRQDPLINPSMTETILVRYIKIPEPAPKNATIKFQSRVIKDNIDWTWIQEEFGEPSSHKPTITLTFTRGQVNGEKTTVNLDNENNDWKPQTFKLTIPQGAEYLRLEAHTRFGHRLAIGNWTIE